MKNCIKTLEDRLGQSFKTVSEHLEKVQLGLGEMQSLATGVGDLKRVLSNVKTRGVMGEIQLGNILEQLLTPESIWSQCGHDTQQCKPCRVCRQISGERQRRRASMVTDRLQISHGSL